MIRIGKRKMINGKKVLMGGTLAVSVASLAVGSVALANQSTVREVETEPVIIPVPSDNSQDLAGIKEMADEAFNEANRASFEIRTITEQMNTNIEIYNNGFKTLVQQLDQTFKGLEEMNKQFKDWKEGTEEAMKEFKKEYAEIKKLGEKLKTIKAVSDIDTMQTYVTEKVEPYMKEKIQLNNKITKLTERLETLEKSLELLTDEFDDLREEVTAD